MSRFIKLAMLRPVRQGRDADIEAWLSASEQARYFGYRVEHARQQFLAARILLKTVLAGGDVDRARRIVIDRDDNGRPHLRDLPGHISISHCDGAVAIAYAQHRRIGIDIEHRPSTDLIDEIATEVLTSGELLALEKASDRCAYFQMIWTAKEAALKCAGTGFLTDPRSIEVFFAGDTASVQSLNRSSQSATYDIQFKELGDRLQLAVATVAGDEDDASLTIQSYDYLNLPDGTYGVGPTP